jgi:hypothetical protein
VDRHPLLPASAYDGLVREDFSTLKLPRSIVQRFPPEQDALFGWIRPQVTGAMLLPVARCDYGDSASEHLKGLERLRDGHELDQPLDWIPNEVLCLYRWSVEDRDFGSEHTYHLVRAFCCCALLRSPCVHENRTLLAPDSVLPLVESIHHLGEEYRTRLLKFLTWSLETMHPWDEEFLFHGLALLASWDPREREAFEATGEWWARITPEVLSWHEAMTYPLPRSLLDLQYVTILEARWRRLARAILDQWQPEGALREILQSAAGPKPVAHQIEDVKNAARVATMVAAHVGPILRLLFGRKGRD